MNPADHTVLIVDDEDALREAIAFDFKRKGFRVFQASGGRQAIDIIQSEPVDLVISDIRMPEGDGIELLRGVKTRDAKTPVLIFITAFTDLAVNDAYDMGAEGVFAKPFNRKELWAAVQRALTPLELRWTQRPDGVEPAGVLDLRAQTAGPAAPPIAMGQGGFFTPHVRGVPEPGEYLEFQVQPRQLQGQTLRGIGLVEWKLLEGRGGAAAGSGIRFVYLDEESRPRAVAFVRAYTERTFIPKSA